MLSWKLLLYRKFSLCGIDGLNVTGYGIKEYLAEKVVCAEGIMGIKRWLYGVMEMDGPLLLWMMPYLDARLFD
ncbi:hypothetical protein Tco_0385603 [Tanacetum coccineum]